MEWYYKNSLYGMYNYYFHPKKKYPKKSVTPDIGLGVALAAQELDSEIKKWIEMLPAAERQYMNSLPYEKQCSKYLDYQLEIL